MSKGSFDKTNSVGKILFFISANLASRDMALAWLAMIYMVCYIPLIIPSTILMNKYGLRITIITGSLIQAVGSWIKVVGLEIATPMGAEPSTANSASFPVVMLGQTICACAEAFLLGLPALIACIWFSQKEVPIATSIGVFGNQVRKLFSISIL